MDARRLLPLVSVEGELKGIGVARSALVASARAAAAALLPQLAQGSGSTFWVIPSGLGPEDRGPLVPLTGFL